MNETVVAVAAFVAGSVFGYVLRSWVSRSRRRASRDLLWPLEKDENQAAAAPPSDQPR